MSSQPAEYTSAIVANTSIVALLNNDLIRPLDDLVKAWKKSKENQLTIDGKIMVLLLWQQHLVYRKDILKKLNIDVPKHKRTKQQQQNGRIWIS